MSLLTLLILYICTRVKHFICDFLLQTDWMALNKGMPGEDGFKALIYHSFVHAMGTLLIVLAFAPALWWLAVVDLLVHSAIDRVKGVISFKNQWTPQNKWFWWSFGLDQEAHNLTHLAYIVVIVIHAGGIVL